MKAEKSEQVVKDVRSFVEKLAELRKKRQEIERRDRKYFIIETSGREVEITPPGSTRRYVLKGKNLRLAFSLLKNNVERGLASANEIIGTYKATFKDSVTTRYFYYFVTDCFGAWGIIETNKESRPTKYMVKGLFSEDEEISKGILKFYTEVSKALGIEVRDLKTNEIKEDIM